MTIEDIDITFGKSVLIEKSCPNKFREIFDVLCKEVPGSFLHCVVTSTRSVTIIRYSMINSNSGFSESNVNAHFCALRILSFNLTETKHPSSIPFTTVDNIGFKNFLRLLLKHNSMVGGGVYKSYIEDLCMADTRLIVCHKESLPEIILKMMEEIRFIMPLYPVPKQSDVLVINSPFIRPSIMNNCDFLYGEIDGLSTRYTHLSERVLSITDAKVLSHDVNIWRNKLKRKGRRLLLKSITLEPI